MKRILIPLLLVMFLQVCGPLSASSVKDEEVKSIPIEKGSENENANKPRDILIPIICSYFSGSFQFNFYLNFEELEIKIKNTTTGEEWTYISSDFKSLVRIPASSPGIYHISIYADEDYYTGVYIH